MDSANLETVRAGTDSPAPKADVNALVALCAADMADVNALILERMQSDVPTIPALAEHLISAGGKRLRPLLCVAAARLSSCLAGTLPLQRGATTHYRRLVTADGAPLIGRLNPSRLVVIAGLGSIAAFLAPSIARLLAGVPTDEESAWFAAHDPARTDRSPVADLVETPL